MTILNGRLDFLRPDLKDLHLTKRDNLLRSSVAEEGIFFFLKRSVSPPPRVFLRPKKEGKGGAKLFKNFNRTFSFNMDLEKSAAVTQYCLHSERLIVMVGRVDRSR